MAFDISQEKSWIAGNINWMYRVRGDGWTKVIAHMGLFRKCNLPGFTGSGTAGAFWPVLFGHKSSAAESTRRNPTSLRRLDPSQHDRDESCSIGFGEEKMTTILFLIFAVEVLAQFITAVGAAQINNLVRLVAKTQWETA
jgi:hypothetical protein